MGKKALPETEEIDQIFATAKKPTKKTKNPPKNSAKAGKTKKTKKSDGEVKVYTEEELKIGQGGHTDKCPFDCDCCF